MPPAPGRPARWLRGGLVALIGLGVLALPAADYSTRVPDPWWGPETLVGDAAIVALSLLLVAGGVWLARRDWELQYLTTVVVWTYAVTASVSVLFAWAIALQLWVVGDPEPYVIALDGVLIAALVAFCTGVLTAKNSRDTAVVRRTEAEYRALAEEVIDCSEVGTVVTDADGDIAWMNRAAADFFGVDRREAVGRARAAVVDSVLTTDSERGNTGRSPDAVAGTFECRVRPGANRERRCLERCRHPIEEGLHAGGHIEQFTDVTEQREAFDALAAREQALRRMCEVVSAPDATTEETVERLVDTGRELFGVEYGAIIRTDGEHYTVVRSAGPTTSTDERIPPAEARCRRAVEEAGTTQTATRPFGTETGRTQQTVGGFRFDHEAATDGGTKTGFGAYLGTPVEAEKETFGTLCFLGRDAEGFDDWERTLAELIARLVGYELERETDQRAYEETIEHERERLEFINRIVRHNILNGLNLLNARTEHLEGAVGDDPDAAEHLAVVRNRVEDMSDLIETIRTFMNAAIEESEHSLKPVPVRDRLVEKVELAADTYDATFRVHDLPDTERRVEADDLACEVFENVLSNAVEHNDAAEPVVEVWTTESVERLPLNGEAGPAPADATGGDGIAEETERREALTVHIADNGPGIPAEKRRRMLSHGDAALDDPGHGFGFYLVREMMESYGGGVRIRENHPRGTVIDLVFPRHRTAR